MANDTGTSRVNLVVDRKSYLQTVAATLLTMAAEIRPEFHIDPARDRPSGMQRAEWQRIVGAHNQRVALAARFQHRADTYLAEIVALEQRVEIETDLGEALNKIADTQIVTPEMLRKMTNGEYPL